MPAPLQLRMVGVMIGSPEMKLNMVKPQILLALITNLFPSKLPELTSFFFYLPNPQQPPPLRTFLECLFGSQLIGVTFSE